MTERKAIIEESASHKAHSLVELQRLMGSVIANPLGPSQKTREKLLDGNLIAEIASSIIKPNDRLSSIERLEIYNRQYWFRLIDCLYDDFPGLRAILGQKRFYKLVVAYLTKYPSSSFSLRDLGSRLVDFLVAEPKWLGKRSRIGLDMARFEWAQVVAFDSEARPAIKPEELSFSNPKSLKLHLQPYISLLELSYPLDDLVIALHKERSHRAEASSERRPDKEHEQPIALPPRQKIFLIVHRFDNSLYYKRVDKAAFELLTAIESGAYLEEACTRALRILTSLDSPGGNAVASATDLFRQWFETWSKLQWFFTEARDR